MNGPSVVGIDLSSRTLDLVRLAENTDEAEWLSIPLTGQTAWQRARDIPQRLPPASWWDDVYLCAIEKPFGPSRLAQSVLMRVQGAVLAAVPMRVELWEVDPAVWKKHLGLPKTHKPAWNNLPTSCFDDYWTQDARDALGIALYARDTNAAGIAAALGGDVAA